MFHAYDPNSDENLNDLSIPLSAMNYDSVILLIIKVCISEHKDTQGHSMMYWKESSPPHPKHSTIALL